MKILGGFSGIPGKFKRGILSLFVPAILFAITACPGFVIDNIVVSFEGGVAVVGATGTFTCISPTSGDIIAYEWSFGDGTSATGQTVTHQYLIPGQYVLECKLLTANTVVTFTTTVTVISMIAYTCRDGDDEICVINFAGTIEP